MSEELIRKAIHEFAVAVQGLKDANILLVDELGKCMSIAPTPTNDVRVKAATDKFAAALQGLNDVGMVLDPRKLDEPQSADTVEPVAQVTPVETAVADKTDAKQTDRRKRRAPETVDDFIYWFFNSPQSELYNVKCGQYECKLGDSESKTAHTLMFHSKLRRHRYIWGGSEDQKFAEPKNANNIVGIRPIDSVVGIFNASALLYGASHRPQKRPQAAAEKAGAIPIPFETVVSKDNGIGLDLSKIEILDWGGSEKVIIPPAPSTTQPSYTPFYVTHRHFAGAVLLRIIDKYFLFDADRQELKRFGFNPFFTQLAEPAYTIPGAYDSLMPATVKAALVEGRAVKRQGEFFFVPLTQSELFTCIDAVHVPGPYCNYAAWFDFVWFTQVIKDVGAAQYNCMLGARKYNISVFIDKCGEKCDGFVPTDDGIEIDAADVLANEMLTCTHAEGSELARGECFPISINTDELIKKDTWYSGESHTHLCELDSFLSAACSATDTGTGEYNKKYGILHNVSIGETGQNSWARHRATAVIDMTKKNNTVLAAGCVMHTGREHLPLYLEGWHKVIANNAVGNWTVSGDVD
jgi:hypothetical protein